MCDLHRFRLNTEETARLFCGFDPASAQKVVPQKSRKKYKKMLDKYRSVWYYIKAVCESGTNQAKAKEIFKKLKKVLDKF